MNRPDPTAWDSKAEAMFNHYTTKQLDAMASETSFKSPTSDFLDSLHDIHAVNPVEAVKPLREEAGLWEGEAERVLMDGNQVAVFHAHWPAIAHLAAFDTFNLTRAVGEYPEGATVGVETLARLGYSAPRKPTTAQDIRDGVERMMADAVARSTAPTPQQAVADLAHDEKTEGYARRPFRTNFKE